MPGYTLIYAEKNGPGSYITSVDAKDEEEAEEEGEKMKDELFVNPRGWTLEIEKEED
jgi:phosphoribosylformylglycinamidine (FGAM) synthase PurS component